MSVASNAVEWECVLPGGPALCNHIGTFLNNRIYLHGGVSQKRSTTPLCHLFCLDLDNNLPVWREVRAPNSPSLSHHASFNFEDRFLIIVGGWNGKERSSSIFIFDSVDEKWLPHPIVKGFPEGGGLSSHSVLPLNDNSCLVIGREGGLRTQRRSGSAFILRYKSDLSEFRYTDSALTTQSRSCHTICSLSSYTFIIGGRDHNFAEVHSGIKPTPLKSKTPETWKNLREIYLKYSVLMKKDPPCLKSHISFAVAKDMLMVHGGETFDGRHKDARPNIYLLLVSGNRGDWYEVSCLNPLPRDSHVAIITPDNIFVHGGCGFKGVTCAELYKLVLR